MGRRDFVQKALAVAAAAVPHAKAEASGKLGIPGPYPGRVVEVRHEGCILQDRYQPEAVNQMMQKGMLDLTGAPGWPDAWRVFFEPGDVVGIKVGGVGGPRLSSDASVLHRIVDGLRSAGVKTRDIVVFNRYRRETLGAGIDKWIPEGVRLMSACEAYDTVQLGMEGYDPDHYLDIPLVKPGQDVRDDHVRRSYVVQIVTRHINKFINLPVLKHHQSAGVTIALKNMSHGLVNNVNRSHPTPTNNSCGFFIPAVVNVEPIRRKAVLHICDGVRAAYHGGPGGRPRYMWEAKTMLFATDPVALDKTGWKIIDRKRAEVGMAPVAVSKPDQSSTFLNCQVEHIEIAGALGLGIFDDQKIQHNQVQL